MRHSASISFNKETSTVRVTLPLWGDSTGERWIPRTPMDSPHKWTLMRKMLPFDDVMMIYRYPCLLTEARTEWPTSCRRHVQIHFHQWRLLYIDLNFTKCFTYQCNRQVISSLGDGMAPWRWQAIIWTNVIQDPWDHMASLGHNELKMHSQLSFFIIINLRLDVDVYA